MNISVNNNNGLFLVTPIHSVLCDVGAVVLFTHISRCPGGRACSIPGWSMWDSWWTNWRWGIFFFCY